MNVRVTRAYLAGFGTAGSVLACGAVVFVLATAVVALGGWPRIAGQLPPDAADLALSSPGSARGHLDATVATIVLPAAKARVATRTAHRRGLGRRTAASRLRSVPSTGASSQPAGSSDRAADGGRSSVCSSSCRGPSGGVTVSAPVAKPVSATVPTGGVGSPAAATSTDAGQAVSSSGSGAESPLSANAGTTVSGVAGAASSAVSQTGSGIGALTGN